MTPGRWLFAVGVLACVFQMEAIAASESLALLRDVVFLGALTLIWREAGESRLFEVGILALGAAFLAEGTNGTLLSAMLAFAAPAMILGGMRILESPAAATR